MWLRCMTHDYLTENTVEKDALCLIERQLSRIVSVLKENQK